jgi:hypothetical protein
MMRCSTLASAEPEPPRPVVNEARSAAVGDWQVVSICSGHGHIPETRDVTAGCCCHRYHDFWVPVGQGNVVVVRIVGTTMFGI